jgi:hypothetical protein
MKSLEIKKELSLDMCCVPEMDKFPTFRVCDEQMNEINDWEAGKEYTITFKVKMQEKESEEYAVSARYPNGKSETHARFEMLSYEVEK